MAIFDWYKKNSKVEILQKKYTELMKKSYNSALTDLDKSDRLHTQAQKLGDEINYLTLRHADK